jgi:hypothetical protein
MVGWKSFYIIPRILPLCLKLLGGMAHEAREISKQAQALLPDEPLMAIISGVTLRNCGVPSACGRRAAGGEPLRYDHRLTRHASLARYCAA